MQPKAPLWEQPGRALTPISLVPCAVGTAGRAFGGAGLVPMCCPCYAGNFTRNSEVGAGASPSQFTERPAGCVNNNEGKLQYVPNSEA